MSTTGSAAGSGDERARIYNGRYELIRQIARGGTAQVYLARDLLLDRPVALKVLFPELSTDSSFVERFRREAQAAANLSHPNIVPVFDWGESERTYFIVMEYVDGEPLSAIIRSQAPLPGARAVGIAADISKALSYAHRHGVVHRDVKPGNVLLTRDGQVKVTDFGIARAVGADDSVTQTGLVMGTATYFSPEQAQGLGVDGRSDVYALGVVLYEMVTGRPPFSADTPVAIAYKHVSEQAISPRELEPRVPVPLEAIILRAMAKQPGARYATAEDLYADLQRYAQGAPVLAMQGGAAFADLGATQAVGVTQAMGAAATTALATAPAGATTMLAESPPPASAIDRQMPKRRWIGWTIAALLLAVLLGILVYVGGRTLGYFGAAGYFHMPDVRSQTITAATRTLGDDGLVVQSSAKTSKTTKGLVLGQNVEPGKLVRKGESVFLTYSAGPKQVAVPPVVDETYTQAEAAMTKAGLKWKLNPVLPTQNQAAGIVTSTNPPPDHLVAIGSTVMITYTHGTAQVAIPAVANDTVSQATTKLYNADLKYGGSINEPSTTVKSGLVIGTQPSVGTKEQVGTSVQLLVSTGPPAYVPSVVGDTEAVAEQKIRAAGLTPQVELVPGLSSDNGEVQSQSPGANSAENRGTTVVIDVVHNTSTTTTTTEPATTSSVPSTTTKGGGGGKGKGHRRS